MNPHDRKLRLRRSTVRNLTPSEVALVRGADSVVFDTKNGSENVTACQTNACTEGCETAFTCQETTCAVSNCDPYTCIHETGIQGCTIYRCETDVCQSQTCTG